ncbi:MAG: protein translocase subunit SecD [Parachlamydiales bacterium]|nr:protein translocase subunit SecD [Parachlamydiales bacterium]
MQKKKTWQFILILSVLILTVYNILPTIFYYSKPLHKPIGQKQANTIAFSIAERINSLEEESIRWIRNYCSLLKVAPLSIECSKENPLLIEVNFSKEADAAKLSKYMPQAGVLIPFVPSQLSLAPIVTSDTKKIILQRKIGIHFDTKQNDEYFSFSFKKTPNGEISDLYQKVTLDRMAQIAIAIGGISQPALMIETVLENPNTSLAEDLTLALAQDLHDFTKVFPKNSSIAQRYFATFTQGDIKNKSDRFSSFITVLDQLKDKVRMEKASLNHQKNDFVDSQKLQLLDHKLQLLTDTLALCNEYKSIFMKGQIPWSFNALRSELDFLFHKDPSEKILTLTVGDKNPFIATIALDWTNETISLALHDDLITAQETFTRNAQDQYDQLLINEIALITQNTDEHILSKGTTFSVSLPTLTGSKSFLTLDLAKIAEQQTKRIMNAILSGWHPKHDELSTQNFPIYDYTTYSTLPPEKKTLCLVVYTPSIHTSIPLPGTRPNSIYVIAKGLDRIIKKYEAHPDTPLAQAFLEDFKKLQNLLTQNGFIGFAGSSPYLFSDFKNDFIFEKGDYYQTILAATRENFQVFGTKKYAMLEFSDLEQRILTLNKIESAIHEDLLKAKDEYHSAQVSLNPERRLEVPPPIRSVFWDNISLSLRKYFRGDERKILHWGLDLSGGKTVLIELRDNNNKVVTNEADLKQGVNELYQRVNKMGISEVTIQTVNNSIILDFPGSQNFSAVDLIQASSMYFHIVNEKFGPNNTDLAVHVNRFLQEIWNEAVVTNRKDSESINRIAWKHLYGDPLNADVIQPRSASAKILYDHGLRLASPFEEKPSSLFDDSLSKIGLLRGDDFSQWGGQTHPLMIVFYNFTLEGTNLTNIQSAYDPSRGNFLRFDVRGSYTTDSKEKMNPRTVLYEWTSRFAKTKISQTPLEAYGHGKGWRMAVILNNYIVSAPHLEDAVSDSATITGSFTMREINRLVADLKAGSLSFTPQILSEKNVSPELGKSERAKGIIATIVAFFLVVVAMIGYYRFAGMIATVAVFINLLIIWATLQNLQATLSLAGIAGVILTVGMAVDANVLVFERIKEESKLSQRLSAVLQAGYQKAFSAIADSNITTIIAALILLHFDAGPIKGFAITLIIGIASSMFTALFMTRYFFTKWAENPQHKKLNMHDWIKGSNFNFLKAAKFVIFGSIIMIFLGSITALHQKSHLLGMDFTGGYSLSVEITPTEDHDYRRKVENALTKAGASSNNIQVRELTPKNNLRIYLAKGMNESGQPFYEMPLEEENENILYPYENNPRIVWVIQALQRAEIDIEPSSLAKLDTSWTAISGKMSQTMRSHATWGLLLALIAVLIYLTVRFEWKYSISAIICLVHDVVITLATIAILNYFGAPLQIELNTVAALMTIIGYSLNDTIIIFDRIREDVDVMRKTSFTEVINRSLNITLSRTTITSLTTLLVLLALVILGGSTIFSFAFVMTLGVIYGTLSSIFIASPLMLFFHRLKEKKEQRAE